MSTPPTVLVTGASGLLGRKLLARPGGAGFRIRAVSRRAPRATGRDAAVEWVRADLATGDGLEAALAGADVLLHAASSPRKDTERTDVAGTERLLAAAHAAGVRHAIYVSIVGVDRIPVAYYRYKLAAEGVVERGGVPWTILRGTQFHDFIDAIFRQATRLPVALIPKRWLGQPVHATEFADALWECVAGEPRGRAPDVAGPEVLSYGDMLRTWMAARGMKKPLLNLPLPGSASAALRQGHGTAPDRAVGRLTWGEWVRGKYGPATARTAPSRS